MYCVHSKKLIKQGYKNFPSKTSRDVGMVDSVSDATGSCMEKPTGGKSPDTRRSTQSVTVQQPSQHSLPLSHTLDTLSPSLYTSGNILMQLGSVYWSALLSSTFPDTAVYSCTEDFISNYPPWHNTLIYRDCQRDIVRAIIIFQVNDYSYCQYSFILRSFINYASTDLFISHLIARPFALIFAMHEGHMHMVPTVYN